MENYQFIKQIGHGSFGEVWLVKCSKTRKKYVLKRIDLQCSSKREQRAAHLEVKLLSTLKHPNIVPYLDSFYNSKGSLFIVMGYCESGDLYTFIRNQNGAYFEEKQIINWFVQICMALQHLHDRNILHRDLKTQNIFLTKNKLIKIGDLGIARVLNAHEDMATTIIGTPYYMSPEIFAGKPYNQKSDVWSLGCCIYEIATLKHAFNARDIHTLMHKVMTGKVSSLPKMYSSEFLNIISLMMNHDPEKRPSVMELLLHEYIRKYILLQNIPKRSKSSSIKKCKMESSTAAAQQTEPVIGLPNLSNKVIDLSSKRKEYNKDVTGIITIPDINGNGDGNDNSQHRAASSKGVLCQVISEENECNELKTSNESAKHCDYYGGKMLTKRAVKVANCNNSFKENLNPTAAHPCKGDSSFIAEKIRSKNSFLLLNNLTYTIQNTRFKNENYGVGLKNAKFFQGSHPPKSAEELFSHSKKMNSKLLEKRPATCAKAEYETISDDWQNSVCALPHIKNDDVDNNVVEKCSHKIDLPSLISSEKLHFDRDSNEAALCPQLKKSQNFAVDKTLLQKIMDSSDVKCGHLNSAARQRRREMKLKSFVSISVPTSVEFLFPDASEKKACGKQVS